MSFHLKQNTPLEELEELYEIIGRLGSAATVTELACIKCEDHAFPLIAVSLGPTDVRSPVLGIFAGVHGLERIGTHVLLSYVRTLAELLAWDKNTQKQFNDCRLVLMPIVNPGGMYLTRRSNPNGVDLMRNAPVRAENLPRHYIYGGHRISPKLPWYQGQESAPMEPEAHAVCALVKEQIFPASVAITVDIHSGYGAHDRIWFPYAKTRRPFANVTEVYALKQLLDRTYPNHVYRIEPQSMEYLAHGDLWDYLHDEYQAQVRHGVYLPLSLELGSWIWMKKNVKQVFSLLGMFNPMTPHRFQRILRRHLALLDFLYRAVGSSSAWVGLADDERLRCEREARDYWYEKR